MNYDPACITLATHFLQGDKLDTPENRADLATALQQAVEDWFRAKSGPSSLITRASLKGYEPPPLPDPSKPRPQGFVVVR